jgi:hypothetical protein
MSRDQEGAGFTNRIQLTPYHLILLMIFSLALAGFPLAWLFDRYGIFFSAVSGVPYRTVIKSYILTVWSFFIIVLLLRFSIYRPIRDYQTQEIVHFSNRTYALLWLGSVLLVALCIVYLFWKNSLHHPLFSSNQFTNLSYSLERAQMPERMNMHLYNACLKVFAPFSLFLSLFLRKKWMTIVSAVLLIYFITFNLERSKIAQVILLMLFAYLLIGKPSIKSIFVFFLLLFSSLLAMFLVSKSVGSASDFMVTIYRRIFYGQFTDLPYYFQLFDDQPLGLKAILPPYVQLLTGNISPSAAQLVMMIVNPQDRLREASFTAVSVFIGEAFAFGGLLGTFLAPFLVVLQYVIIVHVLTAHKKNILRVFLLGSLIYLLTISLFIGFGYFVLSSIQIIFIFYLIIHYLMESVWVRGLLRCSRARVPLLRRAKRLP